MAVGLFLNFVVAVQECLARSLEGICQAVHSASCKVLEFDEVAEDRLCGDREDHEEHDASHGHSGDSEETVHEGQAEQHACEADSPDSPFDFVHGFHDVIEDHEAYDCHQDRAGCGDILGAHSKDFSENDQAGDDDEIGQGGRYCASDDVVQEVSCDAVSVRNL